MARYLVDTDWVIHDLNRNAQIRDRLDTCRHAGLAVSVTSMGELLDDAHGATNPSQALERVRDFLFGRRDHAGADRDRRDFRARTEPTQERGRPIGDLDLLLAATCLEHGLTLLTNNHRHFEVVEGHSVESTRPAGSPPTASFPALPLRFGIPRAASRRSRAGADSPEGIPTSRLAVKACT